MYPGKFIDGMTETAAEEGISALILPAGEQPEQKPIRYRKATKEDLEQFFRHEESLANVIRMNAENLARMRKKKK